MCRTLSLCDDMRVYKSVCIIVAEIRLDFLAYSEENHGNTLMVYLLAYCR